MIVIAVKLVMWATEPIVVAGISPPVVVRATASPSTIAFSVTVVLVTHTPIPDPPTPTVNPIVAAWTPTPGVTPCPESGAPLPGGSLCEWGFAPIVATEIPVCDTPMPGRSCVVPENTRPAMTTPVVQ